MFIGEHEAKVLSSGRVRLPDAYRDELSGRPVHLTVQSHFDEAAGLYLQVRPAARYRDRQNLHAHQPDSEPGRLLKVSRDMRLAIPTAFRRLMQLDQEAPLILVGGIDCLEMWRPEAYAVARAADAELDPSDLWPVDPLVASEVRRAVETVAIDAGQLERALEDPALIASWIDELGAGPDDEIPVEAFRSIEAVLDRISHMLNEAKVSPAEDDLLVQISLTIREELSGRVRPPRWRVLRMLLSVLFALCVGLVSNAMWELWGRDLMDLIGHVFD